MAQFPAPFAAPAVYARPRLHRRLSRRGRPRLEPTVLIQSGGMVELALRELGAVLVRVLPPES